MDRKKAIYGIEEDIKSLLTKYNSFLDTKYGKEDTFYTVIRVIIERLIDSNRLKDKGESFALLGTIFAALTDADNFFFFFKPEDEDAIVGMSPQENKLVVRMAIAIKENANMNRIFKKIFEASLIAENHKENTSNLEATCNYLQELQKKYNTSDKDELAKNLTMEEVNKLSELCIASSKQLHKADGLQDKLDEAIQNEDFEKAAKLRDEINKKG